MPVWWAQSVCVALAGSPACSQGPTVGGAVADYRRARLSAPVRRVHGLSAVNGRHGELQRDLQSASLITIALPSIIPDRKSANRQACRCQRIA